MTMIEEAPRPEWAEINARQSFNIGEQVKDLRRMVQEEIDSRAEVERFVDASREREHRLRKAIAALEGVPLGAGGRPKVVKTTPAVKARPKTPQVVSQDAADEILAAAKALLADRAERTFTRTEIREAVPGRSRETVRRGLVLLREQQRIRLAGKQGAGATAKSLYALMPDVA
jgi:hypothetical protein